MQNNHILLSNMEDGQEGIIIEIKGGRGLLNQCDRIGIRIGKNIKKISQQPIWGPVIFEQDNMKIAIGFRMASKILIDLDFSRKSS